MPPIINEVKTNICIGVGDAPDLAVKPFSLPGQGHRQDFERRVVFSKILDQ
jgi:hypothetical protein